MGVGLAIAFGGGGKNTAAKIAGAAAGGYAGNKTQEHMQAGDTYQTTERVCRTEYDVSESTIGYNVEYRIGDKGGMIRMDHDPGDVIPLQDGKLVLSRSAQAVEPSGGWTLLGSCARHSRSVLCETFQVGAV